MQAVDPLQSRRLGRLRQGLISPEKVRDASRRTSAFNSGAAKLSPLRVLGKGPRANDFFLIQGGTALMHTDAAFAPLRAAVRGSVAQIS